MLEATLPDSSEYGESAELVDWSLRYPLVCPWKVMIRVRPPSKVSSLPLSEFPEGLLSSDITVG
jgi:hypothetical protein